jgi:mycofactocin glycosyltransferase
VTRPPVNVVIPFAGPAGALRELLDRAATLRLDEPSTITVVDNRARPDRPDPPPGVRLVEAAARHSSYHARNAGARLGDAPWILFLDADVDFPPDLADRYLDEEPGERTAILAGAILDAPGRGAAARYAVLTSAMAQPDGYALTANCLVRREAFERPAAGPPAAGGESPSGGSSAAGTAGGFAEVRSGGDADLSLRLRVAGWEIERRDGAAVTHRGRASVPGLLRQRARHGAGAAWVESRHPGTFPARPLPGVARHALRRTGHGVAALARGRRDEALVALLDGPALVAFELGRRLPN